MSYQHNGEIHLNTIAVLSVTFDGRFNRENSNLAAVNEQLSS